MSEYTPITGELRDAMETDEQCGDLFGINYLRISEGRLCRLCDAIDAIHARLERENAALKAELDRVLGEQDNGAIMPLPKDMNDEPIHIGDVMQMGNDPELREVAGFYMGGFFAWLNGRLVPCAANLYRHHQPDTWERIIEDAIGEGMARQRNNDSGNFYERANPMNNDDLVARCKALCERTKEDA